MDEFKSIADRIRRQRIETDDLLDQTSSRLTELNELLRKNTELRARLHQTLERQQEEQRTERKR